MSNQRALLEAFVVENRDLELLEALLAEFNIFEAIGAVRQELRHSDFLAFLMDPAQNHGLGDAFLKRLLKRVLIRADNPPISAVEIDVADMQDAIVLREWRNIDILVHDAEDHFVCAIENKVGSGEHSGQLSRYRDIVTSEFPDHRALFIYLTPEGDGPSEEAYISLSYGEVADLVDTVRETHESTLGADVSTLMKHYTAMLRRHIVSDSEIAELCRRIYRRHKQALDLIFEHRPDLHWDIAEYLKGLIEDQRDVGFVLDHSNKSYVRCALLEWDEVGVLKRGRGWTPTGRILLFEFRNSSNRLTLNLVIGPGPDPIRQILHQTALRHPRIFRGVSKRLYPKWTTIYKAAFLRGEDYEESDFEVLTDKIDKAWKKFLTDDLPAIRKIITETGWPPVD
ncbi:MAG: PD-(D/E)XK nuclease family protein [Calditrichaeota bacterium]|nr:PD-(D/E)XK nuclease family protein [Calditrichota bacterium]